jgi:uncharacterized protein with ParB-like and HNH nuclease domain
MCINQPENEVVVAMEDQNVSLCIQQLFKKFGHIRIPAYQRAYSWENKQCTQFLEDLLEQKGKQYYLGQLLFERDGNTFFVIDGQQRLTTIVIFLSTVAKILNERNENTMHLTKTYLTDVFKTIVNFRRIGAISLSASSRH